MNPERAVAEVVKTKIVREGPGSTFSYRDFDSLSFQAVAKALSRFVKEGWLVRVRRGVYYYPKETVLGKTSPKFNDVLAEIPWSHGVLMTGSTSAPYNLGITTQVPAEVVLIGDYPNRTVDLGGNKLKIRRRKIGHLKRLGKTEFFILETIRQLNKVPGAGSAEIIAAIKKHIFKSDVDALVHAALKEPPRVRAVLGAILDQGVKYRERAVVLKESLNPLTTYKLGLDGYLKNAKTWGIR